MKDPELDQLLKSAPVPDRPQAYWDEFFRRVVTKAHGLQTQTPAGADGRAPDPFRLRFRLRFAAVGLGLTVLFLLVLFALNFRQARRQPITDSQLAAARKYLQEIETLFPNQVQAIAFDQEGSRLTLAERADVPVSSPLYLRICGASGCKDYLTFSGQEIQLDGQKVTVLAEARGGIILAGNQFVWSSAARIGPGRDLKVEARNLGLTAM